jgi:hypothetical protein
MAETWVVVEVGCAECCGPGEPLVEFVQLCADEETALRILEERAGIPAGSAEPWPHGHEFRWGSGAVGAYRLTADGIQAKPVNLFADSTDAAG